MKTSAGWITAWACVTGSGMGDILTCRGMNRMKKYQQGLETNLFVLLFLYNKIIIVHTPQNSQWATSTNARCRLYLGPHSPMS